MILYQTISNFLLFCILASASSEHLDGNLTQDTLTKIGHDQNLKRIWEQTEHVNAEHVNTEHVNTEHVKTEPVNTKHVNTKHINTEHLNTE